MRSSAALLREPRGRRVKVPVCYQTEASDCGPACLVMALHLHGIAADLGSVRGEVNSGRNGASARLLLEVARRRGLSGRGVRATVQGLRSLSPGSILFWNFNHFVVLEKAGTDYVDIIDPATGHRRLSTETVSKAFTGVALEFDAPLVRSGRGTVGAPSPWLQLVHFLPRGRELRSLCITSGALLAFEFALPVAVDLVVGRVLPEHARSPLVICALAAAAICVLFLVLQLARSRALTGRQAVVEKRLGRGIVEHLASLPYGYFTTHNAGDLAMRVRTSSTLNQVLSVTAIAAIFDSLLIVVYLAVILVANALLAGLVIVLIVIQAGVLAATWRRQARLSHEVLEQPTRAQNELVELLESITTLKAAGLESDAAQRWSHSLVREVARRLESRRSLALSTAISRAVQFVAPIAVLLAGCWLVLSGRDSLGETLGFMALTTAMFAPLESVFDTAAQLATARPTLARLGDVLGTEPEPSGRIAAESVVELGRLRVRELSFRYPGSTAPAVHDVGFAVEPGQFVAVIGRSGSGKSTLGMLLAGLQTPDSGSIVVGGTDLADLDRPGYRRRIAYINQNAHLFGGSIQENIKFGSSDVSRDDFSEAVRLARIDEEIIALPMGYETLVGPGGHGLSGGQRQRVVLARALARRPRLLILDEATSALDPALEDEILRGLLGTGITVIAIAHRLTVLDEADQVLVMRDGRIVESGLPAELHAVGGGEFACLT
jgi:ABC-type bacteriocin/lantibiotic exporter with double-glycine peptidase domain